MHRMCTPCSYVCSICHLSGGVVSGSLFLDGGIDVADKVFGEALFMDEPDLLYVWVNVPQHPLQVCHI